MASGTVCAPTRSQKNWTSLLWLVYLLWLPVDPLLDHAPLWIWALTAGSVIVFLPLYLYGIYVTSDPRRLTAITILMFVLGTALMHYNIGASAYFVYGSGFIGYAMPPRRAYVFLLGYCLAIPLISGLLLHDMLWGLTIALVFSSILGVTNVRAAEEKSMNARLQLAHDEVARLAQVAERERIARDLHDVLGHTLSLIVLKSELASKLTGRDADAAAAEIRDVEKIAREALGELREAVTGYRSAGIAAEIDRARAILETAGVAVDAQADEFRLPPTHEGVLALAIRESVTNVVRHADAHTVRLRLAEHGGVARYEITDDGRGSAVLLEGNGLAGMRERIEALGGTMEREGRAGTRLVLTLPLTP
jgi:two-component system sensor histidine kinase DesK